MGKFVMCALILAFIVIVFVLPVITACRFLLQHQQSAMACAASAVISLLVGGAGFFLLFGLTAFLVPGSRQLIDMQGTFYSCLLGALAGLPLGTWTGAWSVVWFVLARQHG